MCLNNSTEFFLLSFIFQRQRMTLSIYASEVYVSLFFEVLLLLLKFLVLFVHAILF